MPVFRGTGRSVGFGDLRPQQPASPDINVSEIAASVVSELADNDVRDLLEECARRAAIAARQEASRRTLAADSLQDAWHGILAIAVEGE